MKIVIETYSETDEVNKIRFDYPNKTRTDAIKKVREKLRKMGWEEVVELTGISQFKIIGEK